MKFDKLEMTENAKTYTSSLESNIVNLRIIWCRIADNSNSKWNMNRHYHSFYELHVALEGYVVLEIAKENVRLNHGNLVLIPPRQSHVFQEISSEYREFVVGFYLDSTSPHPDGQHIQRALQTPEIIMPTPVTAQARVHVDSCVFCINHQPYFSSAIIMNLYLLLLEISRQIAPQAEEEPLSTNELIAKIQYYISSTISDGLTTKDIASYVNISPRHLNRLLETQLHKSVNELITEEKMKLIRRLLSSTDMTLDQIATLAGFSNPYNMSRAFKKEEGMSPGKYRYSLNQVGGISLD